MFRFLAERIVRLGKPAPTFPPDALGSPFRATGNYQAAMTVLHSCSESRRLPSSGGIS
jgi:hypothetical protein